jgi:hypothetical protein
MRPSILSRHDECFFEWRPLPSIASDGRVGICFQKNQRDRGMRHAPVRRQMERQKAILVAVPGGGGVGRDEGRQDAGSRAAGAGRVEGETPALGVDANGLGVGVQ